MRVAASSSASPPLGPSSIGAKPCTASARVMPPHGDVGIKALGVLEEQLRMTRTQLGDRRQR